MPGSANSDLVDRDDEGAERAPGPATRPTRLCERWRSAPAEVSLASARQRPEALGHGRAGGGALPPGLASLAPPVFHQSGRRNRRKPLRSAASISMHVSMPPPVRRGVSIAAAPAQHNSGTVGGIVVERCRTSPSIPLGRRGERTVWTAPHDRDHRGPQPAEKPDAVARGYRADEAATATPGEREVGLDHQGRATRPPGRAPRGAATTKCPGVTRRHREQHDNAAPRVVWARSPATAPGRPRTSGRKSHSGLVRHPPHSGRADRASRRSAWRRFGASPRERVSAAPEEVQRPATAAVGEARLRFWARRGRHDGARGRRQQRRV